MRPILPVGTQPAMFPAVSSDKVSSSVVRSDKTPAAQWFFELARELWPLKTAASLACLTSAKERTCYRYSGGEVCPPADFLVELLRSAEGERVLDWIMRGSKEKWDINRRRARRLVVVDDKHAAERQQIEMEYR